MSGVEFSLRATIADRPPVTADTEGAGSETHFRDFGRKSWASEPEPSRG